MSYVWQRWLLDELRAAGATVVPVAGWQNRGRPASTGRFTPAGAVTSHHTGIRSSASDTSAGLRVLVEGRPDLPGPLCQVATGYDGVLYLVAAGRANHAGRIGRPDIPGMPNGADGNALALGNEVMTDGRQTLPTAQRDAIALFNAVVLAHFRRGEQYAHRHADISATGKWDIGQLTTAQVRGDAAAALRALEAPMPDPSRGQRVDALHDKRIPNRLQQVIADIAMLDLELEAARRADQPTRVKRLEVTRAELVTARAALRAGRRGLAEIKAR